MVDTLQDGHDELYHHAKFGEIEQRAPAVGAKNFTGRMPRSGKLPVLFLLTGQKSGFRPAGETRCTDSGQTLQDRREPGSAWLCKI